MKLSKATRDILKNLNTINPGIVFKSGNVIKTMSVLDHIYVTAYIEETFPVDFNIFELSELLNTLSTFNDPEITFTESHIPFNISEGKNTVKYVPSPQNLILNSGWTVDIEMTEEQKSVSFLLTKEVLEQILKTSSILSLSHLAITNDGLKVFNKLDPSGNQLLIEIDFNKKMQGEFSFELAIQYLKLIPQNYIVDVGDMSRFVSESGHLEYFISLES